MNTADVSVQKNPKHSDRSRITFGTICHMTDEEVEEKIKFLIRKYDKYNGRKK